MSKQRPEELGVSPASFYDTKEAKKYHESSRITHIQDELTNRAIELLALPPGKSCYVLDVGCGSGLSGKALERAGHYWVGCDISPDMLSHAMMHMEDVQSDEDEDESGDEDEEEDDDEDEGKGKGKVGGGGAGAGGGYAHGNSMKEASGGSDEEEDEDEDYDSEEDNPNIVDRYAGMKAAAKPVQDGGDVLQADMGQGLPYRPGSFDGVISISALQWLCYANSSDQDPRLRLNRFFSSLYSVLKRDAKAVLQFYPENAEQVVIIAQAAARVGFAGGVLVDYPNSTKAKKYFLCLSFERTYQVPQALGTGASSEQNNHANNAMSGGVNVVGKVADRRRRHGKGKVAKKSTEWIKKKKELHKRRGKDVKTDSKFTGRRRARGF